MQKIGILYHPMKENALPLAERIEKHLGARGVSCWICSAWEGKEARQQIKGTDLILTIGGDGTILRAVQTIVPEPTAITGINIGNLGFMTELEVDEAEDNLDALLEGRGWIDERHLIETELTAIEGAPQQKYYALNDVVLARGAVARVIYVEARINGEKLTTYKADGVIVSTATGSTGYALSANGPILYPQSRELLLLPVSPHLSSSYALVLPESSVVELLLTTTHSATISVDGHINISFTGKAIVTVKPSKHTVRFLRLHSENAFYSTLDRQLKGII